MSNEAGCLIEPAAASAQQLRGRFTIARGAGSRSAARPAGGIRVWRPLSQSVIDIMCAEGMVPSVTRHVSESLQIVLPMSRFILEVAGRRTTVEAGRAYVALPLAPFAAHSIDGAPFGLRVLYLAPELCPGLQTEADDSELRIVDNAAIAAELSAFFDEFHRPFVSLSCTERLQDLLRRTFVSRANGDCAIAPELCGRSVRMTGSLARARDYVRAHVTETISLDDIASAAALSKYHLLREFRRGYGVTPHEYQAQLRLAHARRLIGDGSPIANAAYDAGFSDQSHLTRRFAAYYGLTPARYARNLSATFDMETANPFGTAGIPITSSAA
jgi:AraC-like DNA-binding protein